MEALKARLVESYVRARESGRGQGYVEYILIIGLVCLAVTAALTAFKDQISAGFNYIGNGV